MSTDLEVLRELAKSVYSTLGASSALRDLLDLRGHAAVRTKSTDGWYSTIARFRKERLYLELWLDRWTGHTSRTLWYGITTKRAVDLEEIATHLSPTLGQHLERRNEDAGQHQFVNALSRDEYGTPILELYKGSYSFYGSYLFPKDGRIGRRAMGALTQDVIEFTHAVAGTRPPDHDHSFPEGQLAERRHHARERNSAVVRKAKLRAQLETGRLECEVCGFDFRRAYGQLGEDFIEAHHLVPLSESEDTRRTRITDLALVCANCHRMLHRRRPWLTRESLRELLIGTDWSEPS